MDLVTSNYLPGDPRLIDQIVYELKSQGIFDQFRKECIADVDTKPAYQNLSQRVEGSVMNFLKKQRFSEDMNKNQLREQLRKNIFESGFLETGVERIVDQVVNPKINTVFLPKVQDVVYRYLGIEKPNQEAKQEEKLDIVDLLPNDLEAISPESVNDHSFNSDKKDESIETNENSLNSSNTKTEDESPPFELLEENTKFSVHEENSVDSHLSGISGLASHDSNHSTDLKEDNPMDISQDVSQNSLNSETNLSIVTSEEDVKMEICEDSNLSENKEIKEEICGNNDNDKLLEIEIKEEKENIVDEKDIKEKRSGKIEEKAEDIKVVHEIKMEDKKEATKSEDKKTHESRNDFRKSHDKHKSSRGDKDRKDNKDKKSRSKSESKSKDKDSKSHSKHSSSSKDKEKKDYRNGKDKEEGSEKEKQVKKDDKEREKSKDKSSKNKEKLDKNKHEKDRVAKDKERSEKTYKEKSDKDRSDKEKTDRDKNRPEKEKSKSDRDKDKLDKDKSDKDKADKDKSDKEKINKSKLEKDKPEKEKSSSSKHVKEKSINSSKRDSSTKEKDTSEDKSRDKGSSSKDKASFGGSKHKESSNKDKDKNTKDKDSSKKSSLSSSSSKSKEKNIERKGSGDTKSKSSDKHKKFDKDKSHHNKTNSPVKKDKDKKPIIDDHYSLKDKKSERRSTDRDSNDGSSKMSRNGSFTDSFSQSFKGSSKESSEVFSSGSGDSSNSDKMEDHTADEAKEVDNVDVVQATVPQAIKYIKPKFASNIHEAMKIMKIRKQLAKMERQNQLSLAQVHPVRESQGEPKCQLVMKKLSVVLEKSSMNPTKPITSNDDAENGAIKEETHNIKKLNSAELITKEETITKEQVTEESPMLKSLDLSMESFEALEARLAQEMSNVNYHMYGEEDDSYEYSTVSFSPVKKRKASDEMKHPSIKKISFDTSSANVDNDEVEFVVRKKVEELTNEVTATKNTPISIFDSDTNDKEIVDKQGPGPAEEISLIENGLVTDFITNVNVEDIKLVVADQITESTEETITVESGENVLTGSHSDDIEIGLVDKEVNGSTEKLHTIVDDMPTIPHFITNDKVDNQDNKVVIEIEAFTEQGTLVNLNEPMNICDFNTNVDKEIELVEQVNDSVGEMSTIKRDGNEIIVISDSLQQTCDVPEEVDIPIDETEIISHGGSNSFVENAEELVIDYVQEPETLISVQDGYDNSIHVEKKEELDKHMNYIKKTILEDLFEPDDVEMDALQIDSYHNENLEGKEVNDKFKDVDEFRGFDDAERNNANVIKLTWKISELERNILEKLNNGHIARNNIPELARIKSNKPNSPRKEEGIILKHGLSLEATIKEVTNMSSTIQDLLQKNGKKLFIKIDKLEHKIPSEVLVSLQGMETNEIVASPVCEVNDVICEVEEINRPELKDGNAEARKEKPFESNGEETNKNGQIFKKPLNVDKVILTPKSNNNGLKEKKDCRQDNEWEDDDSPCYYFVNSNSKSEKHLKVLNDMIKKLEKAVEKQSLQIQNNIPAVKTRGRKRKTQSTENNNSISADCKPEPKRKQLSNATPHQNGENLCNTSFTFILDVSQNQSFSLPLSPAESEKSDEHKKEEPLTVKTKRTGRVSNTKRYSSEDLYKPRPVLRYSSSRRRSAKQENKS